MTVLLLIKASEYFKTIKVAVNSNTKRIVQLFETGTEFYFCSLCRRGSLFSGTAIEALLQMYAFYWVFNIEYPSDAKVAYTFISAVLFRKKVQQYYTNVSIEPL